jgi:hypothetical protein
MRADGQAVRKMARASLIPGPDLFGFVPQVHAAQARRPAVRKADLDELQNLCEDAITTLQHAIESALEDFALAIVDFENEEHAGEMARLLEELDDEITSAIRLARREVVL